MPRSRNHMLDTRRAPRPFARRRRRRRAALAFLVLALAGCGAEPRTSAVLLTLDTTRYDALSTNGVTDGTTPRIDALAREGVVFDRAYTVAPLTLPAHASMLTGLVPPRHTLRTNGKGRLPSSAATIAEAASAGRLRCAAFVSAVVLDGRFGLDQGFERFDAPAPDPDASTSHYAARRSEATVERALDWLATVAASERYFLWVHLWDPHAPLEAPAPFAGSTPTPYLDEVASMDAAIGRLLDGLRARSDWDATTVVVVADHGEAFGEHGEFSHGTYCFEPTLRVPLIVRAPGRVRTGSRDARVVSVVDVAPTLADALGLSLPSELDGRSLLGDDRGGAHGAYFESYYGYLNYGWSPLAGWIDASGKYIHGSRPVFFDPFADPGETIDLASSASAPGSAHRAAMERVLARPALAEDSGDDDHVRGATLELRSLGYAGVDTTDVELPHPLAPSGRPSPMERVAENRDTVLALAYMNEGAYADAERLYAEILEQNEDNYEALESIGLCQLRQGEFDEALASYARAAAKGRLSARGWTYYGVAHRATGDLERALELYHFALEQDPYELEALWQLADALEDEGRSDEARDARERMERLTRRDAER